MYTVTSGKVVYLVGTLRGYARANTDNYTNWKRGA
jgi:hypothetical protein